MKEIVLPQDAAIEFSIDNSKDLTMRIKVNGELYASATIMPGITGEFSFGTLKTPKHKPRFVFSPNINLSLFGTAMELGD